MRKFFIAIFFTISITAFAQVTLEADGPGNTYELINNKLAPNYDVVETPDCIHTSFGRHIAEVFDTELNKYVFEFYIHVTPDNDRCLVDVTDRQRLEIKTYEPSPDNLKGVVGETVTYKWKFRLPVGFKPSTSFTHIHQIKPVGGDDGNPLFTLTPRKGTPNKIELIHDNTTKVTTANLSLFEGVWVECTEIIKIGAAGTYSMLIKKVSDGSVLLSYSSGNLMTIRPDNNFIRPKWGIYRSLNDASSLRDEAVRFADFYIKEGEPVRVGQEDSNLPADYSLEQNYPNPFNPETTISYQLPAAGFVTLKVYDVLGNEVVVLVNESKNAGNYSVEFDGSSLCSGIYIYRMHAGNKIISKRMVLLK